MNEKSKLYCSNCRRPLGDTYLARAGFTFCNTACSNIHEAVTGVPRTDPIKTESNDQLTLFADRFYG